jgi:hypothetical protein
VHKRKGIAIAGACTCAEKTSKKRQFYSFERALREESIIILAMSEYAHFQALSVSASHIPAGDSAYCTQQSTSTTQPFKRIKRL